jgi:hypothetical protein
VQRILISREGGIPAVSGEGVLEQVVGAEAGERQPAEVRAAHENGRGDFQHHAKLDVAELHASAHQVCARLCRQVQKFGCVDGVGDHGGHHLDWARQRGAHGCPQLPQKESRPLPGQPQRSHA